MPQLIQRLNRLRREGQLKATIIRKGRTQLAIYSMRWGLFALSLWLTKRDPTCSAWDVGIYRYQGVESWIDAFGERREIYPARSLTLKPVARVGYRRKRADLFSYDHRVTLPAVSINILRQVEVIGASEMLFTDDGSVLYDELALGDVGRYGSKTRNLPGDHFKLLPAANRQHLQCLYYREEQTKEIPRAISLLKDHSQNYYHWLLECLPRAIVALCLPDWQDDPLLIDAGLADQIMESLRLLSPARQHITVSQGHRVAVKELCFPSVFSPTHDYYGKSPGVEDFLIAPEAIWLLRESFLPYVPSSPCETNKQLIYVARSGGTHRSITNEVEVINALERIGFSIVYPGELSFVQQITLFAKAKIIVGPTGAGMANIVFSEPACKIVVLAPVTSNANYYLFAQIAQYLDQKITYVGGKPDDPDDLHSSYQIDVAPLESLLADLIAI